MTLRLIAPIISRANFLAKVIAWDDWESALTSPDVIVSSVSAEEPVLKRSVLEKAMARAEIAPAFRHGSRHATPMSIRTLRISTIFTSITSDDLTQIRPTEPKRLAKVKSPR